MRTKFAREIRAGIVKAQWEVGFTTEIGRPPYASPGELPTDLSVRAYNRTVAKLVVKQIVASGERIQKSLKEKGWIE